MSSKKKKEDYDGYLLMTPAMLKGHGRCSSVSLCKTDGDSNSAKTVVVSVRDVSLKRALYYSVGIVDKGAGITYWGPGRGGVEEYGTGQHPSVCLYKSVRKENVIYALECHTTDYFKMCYYRVGQVDIVNKSIKWGDEKSIGSGVWPKICVNEGGSVVVLMEEKCSLNGLRYLVGTFNEAEKKIAWKDFKENQDSKKVEDFKGVEPDIAIHENTVVAIYRSIYKFGIKCNIGTLNDKGINWSGEKDLSGVTGLYPVIGFYDDKLVEIHQIRYRKRLATSCGQITDKEKGTVQWGSVKELDYGERPSVTLYGDEVFKMHGVPVGFTLFYAQGKLECNCNLDFSEE